MAAVFMIELPWAPGSKTPTASPGRSPTSCAPCPRFARRSSSAASFSAARTTSRARHHRHQFCPQIEARGDAEGSAAQDRQDARRSARHPLLVPQGQRPARPSADHRGAGHRLNQRYGEPDRERDALDSATIENPISTAELDRPELRVTPKRCSRPISGSRPRLIRHDPRSCHARRHPNANLAKFNAGDRLIPIRLELDPAARARVGILQDLKVPTSGGATTPLSAVGRLFQVSHAHEAAINRYDRTRRVTIEGDLQGRRGARGGWS